MFVTSLSIKKQETWEKDAGQFKGVVVLEGDRGKQEIQLSASAMSRLFGVIAAEVQETARHNAQLVRTGMDEAIHAPLLAASAEVPSIEEL